MIERPLQFYFRGSLRQIAGPSPTRTVLQYLLDPVTAYLRRGMREP